MVTCLFESHKKEWQKKNKPVWLCHLDPDLMYLSTCHTSLTEQIMQLFFLAHKGPWFLRASTCIISQRLIGTPVNSEVKLGKWNTVSSAKDGSRKLARRNEYWRKTENSCLWRTEPETLNNWRWVCEGQVLLPQWANLSDSPLSEYCRSCSLLKMIKAQKINDVYEAENGLNGWTGAVWQWILQEHNVNRCG